MISRLNVEIGDFSFSLERENNKLTCCKIIRWKTYVDDHLVSLCELDGVNPDECDDAKQEFNDAVNFLQGYLSWKSYPKEYPYEFGLNGSPFRIKVWKEVIKVAYGSTASYSEIAERIGHRDSVRAVAMAISKNPVPIFVPCHRIVGKNGKLCGFSAAGGIMLKEFLLEMEKRVSLRGK